MKSDSSVFVCSISLLSQTNYELLFHFMDKIRNLFFDLVPAIAMLWGVFLGGGMCFSVASRISISFSALNYYLMNVRFWMWRQAD